jgi:hypothetical protein
MGLDKQTRKKDDLDVVADEARVADIEVDPLDGLLAQKLKRLANDIRARALCDLNGLGSQPSCIDH